MGGTILLIEPYYAGSHKVLMDVLQDELQNVQDVTVMLMTMSGKKWHWRARTSALHFAQNIPKIDNLKCIFTSCVLPLHELIGLRPDFRNCEKIVYFHENQLVYPVRKSKDRDFQYGYNQIMTCLAADVILFNSKFNKDSFLDNIKSFFKMQPDYRPKDLKDQIEPKCHVLYFPLKIDSGLGQFKANEHDEPLLRITWPHRWEFDKNPDLFFKTLYALKEMGKTNFRIIVLGESFTDNPPVFEDARVQLAEFIEHFGFVHDKAQYYELLKKSDIVISTANHEFYGVAMLEGAVYQCFPLAPNNLVYPEIFSCADCLYENENDLLKRLVYFLNDVKNFRKTREKFFEGFDIDKYLWVNLKDKYLNFLIK